MQRFLAASGLALLFVATSVYAEGKGKGLGRALNKVAGNSASTPGLSKAGKEMARAGNGLGRSGALSRAPGLKRGGPANPAAGAVDPVSKHDPAVKHQKQLTLEQRHLEKRLAQAQKLREQAELNGDSELAANADRMEQQAIAHYEQRVAHWEKFGVVEAPAEAPTEASAGEPVVGVDVTLTPPVVEGAPGEPLAETAARPWWKPKWLRGNAAR